MFNILSIFAEAQTFKEWVPFNYRSDIMHESSHFRKIAAFSLTLPWPLWNRSIYIAVSALPVKGENSLIVTMKTLRSNFWLNGFSFEKDPKTTECEIIFCACYIESLGPNKQRLRFMSLADPKFEVIP